MLNLDVLITLQRLDSVIAEKMRYLMGAAQANPSAQPDGLHSFRRHLQSQSEAAENTYAQMKLALQSAESALRALKASKAAIRTNVESATYKTRIALLTEEVERLTREVKRAAVVMSDQAMKLASLDMEIAGQKTALEAEKVCYRQHIERMKEEVSNLSATRTAAVSSLDSRLYELYTQLMKTPGAPAVAELRNGACSSCNIKTPRQLTVSLRRDAIITHCPNCNRILTRGQEIGDPYPVATTHLPF